MTQFLAHSGSSPLFMQSPFTAELGPTKAVIARGGYADRLYATLIAGVPDSDGVGGAALQLTPQPVMLTPYNSAFWAVTGAVNLEPDDPRDVRTLVLINAGGEREAYGALRSSRAGPTPVSIIHLPSHRLLVRRIPKPLGQPAPGRLS